MQRGTKDTVLIVTCVVSSLSCDRAFWRNQAQWSLLLKPSIVCKPQYPKIYARTRRTIRLSFSMVINPQETETMVSSSATSSVSKVSPSDGTASACCSSMIVKGRYAWIIQIIADSASKACGFDWALIRSHEAEYISSMLDESESAALRNWLTVVQSFKDSICRAATKNLVCIGQTCRMRSQCTTYMLFDVSFNFAQISLLAFSFLLRMFARLDDPLNLWWMKNSISCPRPFSSPISMNSISLSKWNAFDGREVTSRLAFSDMSAFKRPSLVLSGNSSKASITMYARLNEWIMVWSNSNQSCSIGRVASIRCFLYTDSTAERTCEWRSTSCFTKEARMSVIESRPVYRQYAKIIATESRLVEKELSRWRITIDLHE